MFANTCCNLDGAVRSEDVRVGDTMFVRGRDGHVGSKVVSITTVTKEGAINPHTVAGTIVANNVLATHFTDETTWSVKSLAPHWYALVHLYNVGTGVWMSLLGY